MRKRNRHGYVRDSAQGAEFQADHLKEADHGTEKTEHPRHLGSDIGWFNISAYNHGIMGYRTPNIDRIAKEGAMFTDWYGQQSRR
jgi:hypothetical protein